MKTMERVSVLRQQAMAGVSEGLQGLMSSPVPGIAAECGIRFVLSAALTGARVFDRFAPFALGFVVASGPGPGGVAAMAGASLGYLTGLGMVSGLRYVASAVFLYAVGFAFYDLPIYKKEWFMPAWAAVVTTLSGILYLSDYGYQRNTVLAVAAEVVFTALSAHLYRALPFPRHNAGQDALRTGLLFLAGTLAVSLGGLHLPGAAGMGVALAGTLVLVLSRRSREEALTGGAVLGLVLDLCLAGGGLYTGALTFGGLLAGLWPQRRLRSAMAFVLGGTAAALWCGPAELQAPLVAEFAAGCVLYLALPLAVLDAVPNPAVRAPARAPRLPVQERPSYTLRQLEDKLQRQAKAFRTLYEDMRSGLGKAEWGGMGAEQVFDRAAEQVCRDCPRYPLCWKQDYQDTYRAFQQMLMATRQRGHTALSDAPADFLAVCTRAAELVSAANLEYAALLHRRQMETRLRSSRSAVWRQYAQLSQLLSQAAGELEYELTPEPELALTIARFLRRHGLEAEIRVGRDRRGRLVVQLTGADLSAVENGPLRDALSRNVGVWFAASPLERQRDSVRLTLVQQDNYQATAGVAAVSKAGETVSGDGASWFRDRDGRLWVALCDGMGSGAGAARQSSLALSLLEDFLQAGVDPEIALATLSNALALRGESELGFTTIDLMGLDLFSGQCRSYKLGAAPTYLRQNGRVKKLAGCSLPAGLELGQETLPDFRSFQIAAGDLLVMISDGILEGEEDQWIWPMIREYRDKSPRTLAAKILERSASEGDDRTVLVLQLRRRPAGGKSAPEAEAPPMKAG